MHWNHRLVRYRAYPDTLGLHEVYYNKAGEPCGMTEKPCSFTSDWSTEDGSETPQTDIIGSLETALKADVSKLAGKRRVQAAVDFSSLPSLGQPGAVTGRTTMAGIGLERVTFANGVRLLVFSNPSEPGRV